MNKRKKKRETTGVAKKFSDQLRREQSFYSNYSLE